MECQVKKNEHLRHLLFALSQGSKAARAADFCQRGIENLVERVEEHANNNGESLINYLFFI